MAELVPKEDMVRVGQLATKELKKCADNWAASGVPFRSAGLAWAAMEKSSKIRQAQHDDRWSCSPQIR